MESVIRRTQDTLGKVIRKPPLTDKLLGKPPFRYLHDIFTEVIRTTGFFEGLYPESELKSDNVKDKDAKISFLQKAIDVVVLVTGEPLAVKPARVVAGHEPERTNELLQAIGKCCLNKLSSEDAVRRVLAGEKPELKGKPPSTTKSQDKKDAKPEERRTHRETDDKRELDIRERSGSRERKERQRQQEVEQKHPERVKEQRKERDGAMEKDGIREREKNDKEKRTSESQHETEKDRTKEKSRREKGKERRSEGSRGKEREKDKSKDRERGRERDRDHEKERHREKDLERERRKERMRDEESQRARDEETRDDPERLENKHKRPEEHTKKASAISAKESKSAADREVLTSSTKITRPSASKLRERRPAKGEGEGDSGSDQEVPSTQTLTPENADAVDGQSNMIAQRRIPRPGSARPAPPRIKHQGSTDTPVPERVSSGKAVSGVIVDQQKKEDDDEEFIVEEASPQPPDMPEMELDTQINLNGDDNHGSLVKKILETKKDYETQPDATNKDKILLSENGRKREKDLVTREIEKLRSSIQILCRSALPLGKIMDYIQEDVDTMQNELHMWRRENRQLAEMLLREQSITDAALEPLKAELVELDQQIKENQDKICTVKGNILRNEEKIQRMVRGISVSSKG
ncbi:TRAF3-interacting protein 1 [Spea bombifrons]|uniref:TRAF3-interacting protein 1 n=1 Tax=Spea bombifrons TaxID=233779 RepID=UPI002349299E|nr:TRAF3-interacting protein 1 [Spea bombifrons]